MNDIKIIVNLEKTQYHMLSRAILDDLYERKTKERDIAIANNSQGLLVEASCKDVSDDTLLDACSTDEKKDISIMAS